MPEQKSCTPSRGGSPPASLGWSHTTLLVITLALILSGIAGWLFKPAQPLFDGLNLSLVAMLTHVWGAPPADNRQFLLAYKVFLCSVLALPILWSLLPESARFRLPTMASARLDWIATAVGFSFIVWSALNFTGFPQQQIAGVMICGLLWIAAATRSMTDRLMPLLTMLLLAVGATIPGLFVTTDFTGAPTIQVVQMQQHYAMCLGFADKIAAGIAVPPETSLYYGVLLPTILGSVQRSIGILTWGAITHIIQASQLLLLALVSLLLLAFANRSRGIALVAFLTVLPWFHCNQIGLNYPNHSGCRFLGVFGGLLAIYALRRLPMRLFVPAVGAIAATSLLANVETGLAMVAGSSLLIILLRHRLQPATPLAYVSSAVSYLVGMTLTFTLFCICFLVLTGNPPTFLNPAKILIYLQIPDLMSLPGPIAPVALLIFLHAAYVLVHTSLMPPSRLTLKDGLRSCVALLILVWELYYFSRPFFANLAGVWALYSVLLTDSLRIARLVALRRRKLDASTIVLFGTIVTITAPYCLHSYREAAPSFDPLLRRLTSATRASEVDERPGTGVSDVLVPKPMGDFLLDKCNFLASMDKAGGIRFVSIYSLLVSRVAKVQQPFPWEDPFFTVNRITDYRDYVVHLNASGARQLLLDDVESDPVLSDQEWYKRYFADLRTKISLNYRPIDKQHGWEIWTRK